MQATTTSFDPSMMGNMMQMMMQFMSMQKQQQQSVPTITPAINQDVEMAQPAET